MNVEALPTAKVVSMILESIFRRRTCGIKPGTGTRHDKQDILYKFPILRLKCSTFLIVP
jgi:hypothetical protein